MSGPMEMRAAVLALVSALSVAGVSLVVHEGALESLAHTGLSCQDLVEAVVASASTGPGVVELDCCPGPGDDAAMMSLMRVA